MRIQSFQFHDRTTGWQLEETTFDAFNLLVGVSGVGKTKIVEALHLVQRLALGLAPGSAPTSADWSLRFDHGRSRYEWRASVEMRLPHEADANGGNPAETVDFRSEHIVRDETTTIVDRTQESFVFEGKVLPKLKKTYSAIALLAEEGSVSPVGEGLSKLLFSDPDEKLAIVNAADLERLGDWYSSLEELRQDTRLDVIQKAYVLQRLAPREWQNVVDLFVSIFPSVDDVRVIKASDPEYPYPVARAASNRGLDHELLCLALHERGTTAWTAAVWISSGMHRTLTHLIEVFLAPPGTVVIIDDFENGLGKNCMPDLVDFITSRAPDLQFIITSHHPYIINNIPISAWKLVQRRGSRVRVVHSRDIPALQRASHFEAFDRLLNLPEYEEGIA